MASTEPVAREINPVIKSTLVLSDIQEGQRLELRVKDIGILTEEHFGGRLGPMAVAKCTFPAGEDVSGFLELVPAMEVPRNGPPLVELTARFYQVGALLGNTSALVEVFEPGYGVPEPGSGVPEPGYGVLGSTSVEPQAPQALPEQALRGAVDVELAAEKKPDRPVPNSWFRGSGVFAIALCVLDIWPPILKTLANMQATGERGPFVSAPFLSYDVLGCGYDPVADTYMQYWEPIADDAMPPALDVVMKQFNDHVTSDMGFGVPVIRRFLAATKEPSHVAVVQSNCLACLPAPLSLPLPLSLSLSFSPSLSPLSLSLFLFLSLSLSPSLSLSLFPFFLLGPSGGPFSR